VTDPWTALVPLAIGSAVLPLQIAVTVLLLRSAGGRPAAVAWVAGMTAVRLAQGVVFGLVLGRAAESSGDAGAGLIESALLLVVAILLLVMAAKYLLRQPDEDAPAPRWMALVQSATPGRAFLLGVAMVGLSAKLWAFTLGALGAIVEADPGQPAGSWMFLAFVLAAESVHLALITIAFAAPTRSGVWLDRLSLALERHSRVIMIVLGLGFGTWFLIQALQGLGVIQ
jgi:threonine/homoserine/homoserine lactone efflux protein